MAKKDGKIIAYRSLVRPANSVSSRLTQAEQWVLRRLFERGFCIPEVTALYAVETREVRTNGRPEVIQEAFSSLEQRGLAMQHDGAFCLTEDGWYEVTGNDDLRVGGLDAAQAELWKVGRWLLRRFFISGYATEAEEMLFAAVRAKAARDEATAAKALLFIKDRGWVRMQRAIRLLNEDENPKEFYNVFELTELGVRVARWVKAHAKRLGDPPVPIPSRMLSGGRSREPWRDHWSYHNVE